MNAGRLSRSLAWAVALALVVGTAAGCSSGGSEDAAESLSAADQSQAEEPAAGPEEVLESFWEASRKSGTYEVVTTVPNQEPYTMTATFTFDGDRFRIDYEDGPTIMSADGVSVVYVDHEAEETQPGQTPASYYTSLFTRPAAELEDQGIDEETGAQKYYFLVEELYQESETLSTWFEFDRTYFAKDGTLVRLVTQGGKNEDAGADGWIEHVFTFGEIDLDPEIDEATFEIPYQE